MWDLILLFSESIYSENIYSVIKAYIVYRIVMWRKINCNIISLPYCSARHYPFFDRNWYVADSIKI